MHRLTVFTLLAAALPAAAADPSVHILNVHPGVPALEIRIVPGPTLEDVGNDPHAVGRVEVARRGQRRPFQTILVVGHGNPEQLADSRFEDVDFDGYADLLLANDGGAKWRGYQVALYDPGAGVFVQNALSRALSEHLGGGSLDLRRDRREIVVTHLTPECQDGFVTRETFAVDGGRLKPASRTDLLHTEAGCVAVDRRPGEDGGLVEVSRRPMPELDRVGGL